MADFKLNDIPKDVVFNDFKKEIGKFGFLTFIKEFQEDKFKKGYYFSFGKFKELKNKNDFIEFCHSKNIIPTIDTERFKITQNVINKSPKVDVNIDKIPNSNSPKIPQVIRTSFIANPSFYFYKDKAYGKAIEDFTLTHNCKDFFEIPNAQTLELTTIYPGLLVGSGYNHPKLPENKDDFQLGFFFDHTTGLPIISGSSIKGLLRSVCEKKEFMQDVYGKTIDIKIFEDNQTIFYDAFILSTKNKQNKIFGSDYITSHFSNDDNGMFKEPNPVKFLKVLPDVTFKFQFKAEEEIVSLFKKIILDFGLGAKTNVGYGKFQEVK